MSSVDPKADEPLRSEATSALQHREAGPPATAELFSDLLSNITQCALAQRVRHGSSDPPGISAQVLVECHRPGSAGFASKRGQALVFRVVFKV
jgi:hypothetical protein